MYFVYKNSIYVYSLILNCIFLLTINVSLFVVLIHNVKKLIINQLIKL